MSSQYKKIIAAILILAAFAAVIPKPARAEAWGTNMASALLKETLEETYAKIKESIVASLRITAIRIIQGRMQALLTGSPGQYGAGGGGMVISDWRNFIYGTAQGYASTVTNTFFMTVQSTATMAVNQAIVIPAMQAIDSVDKILTPDIQNYVAEGKTSDMFKPGASRNPWQAWRIAGQPQNDSGYYLIQGMSQKQAAYESTVERQIAQGVAGQGFKGVDKSQSKSPYTVPAGNGHGAYTVPGAPSRTATAGNGAQVTVPPGSDYQGQAISTPGSIVAMTVAQIQNMGVQMIAMARSIPDVVASMVTQMLTQMMEQGIAKVTQPIDQALSQAHNSTLGAMQQGIQSGMRR
ncbi:MAG: hypothetical protein WC858_05010 [Parcubacteria group bacterium]|jgi:hypothetical protein